MSIWGWVVIYVLVFALLQLIVYRYLANGDDVEMVHTSPPNPDTPPAEEWHAEADDNVRRCPICGAANEPDAAFTYCRNCVSPLGT